MTGEPQAKAIKLLDPCNTLNDHNTTLPAFFKCKFKYYRIG